VGALQDMVAHHPVKRLAAVGVGVTAVPLAATFAATGWLDGLLVAVALLAGTTMAAATVARRQLDQLPLRVAPVAARSRVDGRSVVRFRACLGLGRACRPRVSVSFEPEGGVPRQLDVQLPCDLVCGPFVFTTLEPEEAGAYRVTVAVGDEEAQAHIGPHDVREGQFVGGIAVGRSVRFDGDWERVSLPGSDEPPARPHER